MDKFFTILICILLSCAFVNAQTPVENANFEEWVDDTGGDYDEPAGYWATLNAISKLFPIAPVTASKETDNVHAGNFAVRLESKSFLIAPIGGLLATAFFDTQVVDPTTALKTGQPFTDKPTHFSGWYDYKPEADDSATIALQLTKWVDGAQLLVAEAGIFVHETTEYTNFDLEVEYFSEETPDSILIVFGSSAGAEDFNIQVGSVLYIDDISISYEDDDPSGIDLRDGDRFVKLYPNPASDLIAIEFNDWSGKGAFEVVDLQGRLVYSDQTKDENYQLSVSNWEAGHYFYQYISQSGRQEIGRFVVTKD